MRKMTEAYLQAAFSGESQAHMKYLIFADKAEKDGHARLHGEAKAALEGGADAQISEIHICGAKAERIQAF